MFEINDFEIKELPKVFKKETLTQTFYGLIQDASLNCQKLDAIGIKKASDLLKAVESNELDMLVNKTGIDKSYMQQLAGILSFRRFKPFPLKKYEGIDSKYIENLLSKGLKDTGDLLLSCKTREDRIKIAEDSGIPADCLERMVKIADLMRLPGVKNTRATLYLEAGLDSVEKFSVQDPLEARKYLIDFVEKTKIAKIAPLPKELETQIAWAKLYPIVVES